MPGTGSGADKYYQASATYQKREIFPSRSEERRPHVIPPQKDFISVFSSSMNPVISWRGMGGGVVSGKKAPESPVTLGP